MAKSLCARTSGLILMALLLVPPAYGQAKDPGDIAPEKLKKLSDQLDRTIDQYMGWLTQMYQMDPDQQRDVRNRLGQLKQEHLRFGKDAAAQITPLQQELKFYMEKARKNEPVDKEMVKELQGRIVAIIEKAPMTYNNIIVQTEKLLPQEQVAAGRERQKEFKERMKEFQDRQRRQAPKGPRSSLDPLIPYLDTTTSDAADKLPPVEAAGKVRAPETPAATPAPTTPAKPVVVEVIPLDDWGKYVEDFIGKYRLDSKQAQQCRQILGELRKRADEYRLAHRADYIAAEGIKDLPLRNAEVSRLDKPIQGMFDELKTRVAAIPTDSQRRLAEVDSPASQPAKVLASQPAKDPASRPAVPVKAPASAPASRPAGVAAVPK